MVKMYGSGLVASWRPHEQGGSGGAQVRASEKHCDHIFVFDQVVLMQYHDGFWETGNLASCSITWSDKPEVFIVDYLGKEIPLTVMGNINTIADNLKIVLRKPMQNFVPMSSTDENISAATLTQDDLRTPVPVESVEEEQSSVH